MAFKIKCAKSISRFQNIFAGICYIHLKFYLFWFFVRLRGVWNSKQALQKGNVI